MKVKIVAIGLSLLSLTCEQSTETPAHDAAVTQLTSTGDCSSFTWSRNGPKIAITRKNELWIFDAGSMKWDQITSRKAGGRVIGRSTWSPDGTQLVYEAESRLLYKLDLASKDTTPLPITGSSPRWSVDGKSLFFVRDGYLAQYTFAAQTARNLIEYHYLDYDLFPDSNGILLLWWPTSYFDLEKGVLKTFIGGYVGEQAAVVSISPDGRHFACDDAIYDNSVGDTQDPIEVFSFSDSSSVYVPNSEECDRPAWSHDSKRIAYLYRQNIWMKELSSFLNK
jgi:hypothetical protein